MKYITLTLLQSIFCVAKSDSNRNNNSRQSVEWMEKLVLPYDPCMSVCWLVNCLESKKPGSYASMLSQQSIFATAGMRFDCNRREQEIATLFIFHRHFFCCNSSHAILGRSPWK